MPRVHQGQAGPHRDDGQATGRHPRSARALPTDGFSGSRRFRDSAPPTGQEDGDRLGSPETADNLARGRAASEASGAGLGGTR